MKGAADGRCTITGTVEPIADAELKECRET
jgi:hypothetical protein